jgi:hypothetical protein
MVNDSNKVFVGLDVHKDSIDVADAARATAATNALDQGADIAKV